MGDYQVSEEGLIGPDNVRLRSIDIGTEECRGLVGMNDDIVMLGRAKGEVSEYQGGGKGRKRKVGGKESERRKKAWGRFKGWVERREFTHVLDGANIGYLGNGMGIKWQQIDWVMSFIRSEGGRGCVVMHQRHFDRLRSEERVIVKGWGEDVYR